MMMASQDWRLEELEDLLSDDESDDDCDRMGGWVRAPRPGTLMDPSSPQVAPVKGVAKGCGSRSNIKKLDDVSMGQVKDIWQENQKGYDLGDMKDEDWSRDVIELKQGTCVRTCVSVCQFYTFICVTYN
jgi:hypothetical protein